ncbi:D-ribose ABC transporter substrate-binding protein [Arthrospiribacter ruber]|uniref:D-ribose ABC transporter substrate-binding protein n=1 Tax=Arthrospiribacter ruber TaxID=2487934 RepID=A0A951IVT6_9BACT|nr:D-ribose ABC transporter substrate-binding protein [Arthrospiribacter ruber]MBW3466997.1 D-ribose ABC transporter substrate-binding protein [Arthrospiribacter ruber]
MISNVKNFGLFLIFISTFILFHACKQKPRQRDTKKIAVVISTLNNPWFMVLAESAVKEAESLGHEAKIFDSQNSTALEADHFENAIVSGYDAILFNPTDSDGSISNIQQAKIAGIPVFCMDREVNAKGVATSQILSDSYSGCVAIGKHFVKSLDKKGRYVEIIGMVGDNNTWNRSSGFHSVVDNYPDLIMVAQQSGEFDRNKSMEVMESILQAQPDIDAVFCGNDPMAMGAYQALVAAGLEDKVKVFGFDGASEVITSIQDGKIQATGMQFPELMAKTAAAFADQYFRGEREFPEKTPVSVELVTEENVRFYIEN